MRPLCGAIIAAGSMIGLGLVAVGFGVRFQGMNVINENTHAQIGATSLTILLVLTVAGMVIGLGLAFLGLAYHHEKRMREHLHGMGHTAAGTRVTS